jgi:N-acetylglucosamine-6-phosphate deacetylase
MSGWFTLFTNCRYVHNGELVDDHLVISDETGLILKREGYIGGEAVDLDDNIIAPGFLELHTNGANGFHFTHFDDSDAYATKVDNIARYYATQGVTGFWATIPTVKGEEFQKASHTMSPSKMSRLTHPARSSPHWPPAKSPPPPPSSAPTQRDPTSTLPRTAPTTPRSSDHA